MNQNLLGNKLKDTATFESMGFELTEAKKDEIAQLFSIDPTHIEGLTIKDLSYLNRLKCGRPESLNKLRRSGYEPNISGIITRSDQTEGNMLSNGNPVVNKDGGYGNWSYSPLVNSIHSKLDKHRGSLCYLNKKDIAERLEKNQNPFELRDR